MTSCSRWGSISQDSPLLSSNFLASVYGATGSLPPLLLLLYVPASQPASQPCNYFSNKHAPNVYGEHLNGGIHQDDDNEHAPAYFHVKQDADSNGVVVFPTSSRFL